MIHRNSISDQAFAELAQEWAESPLAFVAFNWPHIKLYRRQVDMLESWRDNQQTFFHAGTGLGKDFGTSLAVLWMFCTRRPCKIKLCSSSEDHLRTVLWAEIQQRLKEAVFPFGFKLDDLRLRLPDKNSPNGYDPEYWVQGEVTNRIESFQGAHLPTDVPRVGCIFDEASGIPDAFYDAADAWAHRMLVIGNPLNTVNFFYRFCALGDRPRSDGGEGLRRKVIHAGAEDSPNVAEGMRLAKLGHKPPFPLLIPGLVTYEEYVERKAEWDPFNIRTRLHGLFDEGEGKFLYPSDWLQLSKDVALWLVEEDVRRTVDAIGVDGGEGRANTVWTGVDLYGVTFQHAMKTPNTMEIAGRTIDYLRRHNLDPSRVFFDRGGGGKQIADRLREQGYPVQTVMFGEPATPVRPPKNQLDKDKAINARRAYKNRRAEMYGILRDLMDPQYDLEGKPTRRPFAIGAEHAELLRQLRPLPLLYDSEGAMYLPPKKRPPEGSAGYKNPQPTIEELVGKSPDESDSLALAVYGLKQKRKKRLGGF